MIQTYDDPAGHDALHPASSAFAASSITCCVQATVLAQATRQGSQQKHDQLIWIGLPCFHRARHLLQACQRNIAGMLSSSMISKNIAEFAAKSHVQEGIYNFADGQTIFAAIPAGRHRPKASLKMMAIIQRIICSIQVFSCRPGQWSLVCSHAASSAE